MHKLTNIFILFLILLISSFPTVALSAQETPAPTPLHLTGHIVYVDIAGGFYGIIGDDGKKYQPTNLSRKLRTNGLLIKCDAQRKEDMASSIMWGTIVEVSNAAQITSVISNDERSALSVLSKRMEAFNTKDLAKLQQIDTLSKELTPEQFASWVDHYANYTLQYIEITSADSAVITGTCYYTRELVNGMTLHGNTDLTAMTFTLRQTPNGWHLTDAGTLQNPPLNFEDNPLADLKQRALTKYKTNNLAPLLQ